MSQQGQQQPLPKLYQPQEVREKEEAGFLMLGQAQEEAKKDNTTGRVVKSGAREKEWAPGSRVSG